MTNGIRRWLSLAIVPLATIMMLGVTSPAQADDFICNNQVPQPGDVPVPGSWTKEDPFDGEVTIENDGDCVIDFDIFATGKVRIQVVAGSLQAEKVVSTEADIEIDVPEDDIEIKDVAAATFIDIQGGLASGAVSRDIKIMGPITMNATDNPPGAGPEQHGNILIRAGGNVSTMDIKNGGDEFTGDDTKTGGVQIDTHLMSGASVPFVVGGGGTNGINGTVSIVTKTGGGTNTFSFLGGVRITNPGGIDVTSMNAIKVEATESRNGSIQLIAPGGVINLPAGRLSADGFGQEQAGVILLSAKTINTQAGTIISTSQHKNATGTVHQVAIAAEEINFAGDLQILSNGNGENDSRPGIIYVLPFDGFQPSSTNVVQSLKWTFPFTGSFFQHPGMVHFNGAGGADLTIQADGDHTQIGITGDDIIFDGGKVTVQAKGGKNNAKHEIVMGFFDFGSYDGTKGLLFNTTDTVEFFVRGEGSNASGGDIQIQVDKSTFVSPKINFKANGPQANSGDGGTILFTTTGINQGQSDTKVKFLADASALSAGDAQLLRNNRKAIFFDAGDATIPVGTASGQYTFSATGGGLEGDGGAIEIKTSKTVRIQNKVNVIDVSAVGNVGDAGEVFIDSNKTVFVQDVGQSGGPIEQVINASGGIVSGEGGTVVIPKAEAKKTTPISKTLLM